ncbi:MAG: hypothetical protein GF398_04780 [Chitinivibrionales bacterium]|nr:hypothetical protein [Chitinivibrionales bacterium]
MIRINLLKEQSHKRRKKLAIPGKLLGIAGGIVAVCILGVSAKAVYDRMNRPAPPEPELPKTHYDVSSHRHAQATEDVVQDYKVTGKEAKPQSTMTLSYADMSYEEKVNYQALFALKVCDILMRATSADVMIYTLELIEFKNVYVVGICPTKKLVSQIHSALERENLKVLPKPNSFIRPNQDGGYKFGFLCEAHLGLDRSDEFVDVSLSSLTFRDGLKMALRQLKKYAEQCDVAFATDFELKSAEKVATYREFIYSVRGTASYVNFVALLQKIYEQRKMWAFKQVSLKAQAQNTVAFDAHILFVTKD